VRATGFKSTVLPAASAGAVFHAGIAMGKLQGDQAHNSKRLMSNVDVASFTYGWHALTVESHRFTAEKQEDLPCARHLPASLRQGFALLPREKRCNLLGLTQNQLAGSIEHISAHLWRCYGPSGLFLRRHSNRASHKMDSLGLESDEIARICRVTVLTHILSDMPLAANQISLDCRHVFRPLVSTQRGLPQFTARPQLTKTFKM